MAKLKAAKSTRRLLLQIQNRLGSANDQDKRMIAAALSSLFPITSKMEANLSTATTINALRETMTEIESAQREMDSLIGVILLTKPAIFGDRNKRDTWGDTLTHLQKAGPVEASTYQRSFGKYLYR